MDGWVIVGTKLDSKQLEKDLKNAERRLQQYEKEAEKLTKTKAKAEIDLQPYEEQKRLIKESTNEMLQYAQTEQEVNKQLDIEKIQLEELNQKYSKQLGNLDNINKKIKENEKNQELMKIQVEETKSKLGGIDVDFNKIGKSTSNVIKKVGKWALAIFSVRSAYMLVRRAVSTLSQYNEDLANKLQSIQLILASALEPLINRLVNLAYKLLYYLNYITKAWFNIDLFSSANEKALKSGAKSAEKMKKSLAGFDEMNIIQDTTSGASASGVSIPSMEDVEIPSWIDWIAKNKDIVIGALTGIATAIGLIKLGKILNDLGVLNGKIKGIKAFGIGLAIWGIINAIRALIKYLDDPSFENFGNLIKWIGVAVIGLGLAFLGLPAVITGAVLLIVGIITKYFNQIQDFIDKNIFKWFDEKIESLRKKGLIGQLLAEVLVEIKRVVQDGLKIFETFINGFKQIFDGIVMICKGDFKNGMKTAFKGIANVVISVLNTLINALNTIISPIRSLIVAFGKVTGKKWTMSNIKIPSIKPLAVGGIVNMPGRGVPIGNAITGEAGKEGVIPLTDSQAMETLGATIGKYININLTNITKLDNRQIAKEQKKINAQNDFAFNR